MQRRDFCGKINITSAKNLPRQTSPTRVCMEIHIQVNTISHLSFQSHFTDTLYLLPHKYTVYIWKPSIFCLLLIGKWHNKGRYATEGVPGCLRWGDWAIFCLGLWLTAPRLLPDVDWPQTQNEYFFFFDKSVTLCDTIHHHKEWRSGLISRSDYSLQTSAHSLC